MNDAEHIARRLRQARQEAGWSQARLGEVLGISHAAVSDLERGVSRIHALDLARMAEALDKPIRWFYPETRPDSDADTIREALEHYRKVLSTGTGDIPWLAAIEQATDALAALDRMAAKGRAWERLYDAVVQTDYGLIRTSGVRRDMDAILAEEMGHE